MNVRSLVVACLLCSMGGPIMGQNAPDGTAFFTPESIGVGEVVTLSVVITRESGGDVQFPSVLDLPEELEQRRSVEVRSRKVKTEWQADYFLVGWRADTVPIPSIEIELDGTNQSTVLVTPPKLAVHGVLPAETNNLELRDPRSFLQVRGFSWWLLMGLVAISAILGWWLSRRRKRDPIAIVPLGPGGSALRELRRLRKEWLEGGLAAANFYDGYEETLRRYVSVTRGWSPAQSLKGFALDHPSLLSALRHSLLARFARVRPKSEGPIRDLAAGEAFIRSEMPIDEPDKAKPNSDNNEFQP